MVKDFYIRNMVCDRCIKVLRTELDAMGFELLEVELGKLKLEFDEKNYDALVEILEKDGFSLIESPEMQLSEKVKIELIHLTRKLPLELDKKLSTYLESKLNYEYSKISKVFSYTEGITIEKYFIKLKIEKVKELIQTREQNFTEISQMLNYSNVNHLSRQFKNETGMSLSEYKSQQKNFRTPLDQIV